MNVGELVGYVDLDDSRFNSGLDRAHSRFSSFAKGIAVAGAAAAVAAGAVLGKIATTGWGEMMDASRITAQLEAGIKSTGNAANVTVEGMNALASSIQAMSGQTDDSIAQTQALLLTFTNIKNVGVDKIFDQATLAAANMAAKMGGDATTNAMQLGKALNDPVAGVAALTRVGVQFTDAQKESIAAMVEAGDVMGAQKVILGELETQFGGAAEAAGKSLPGQLQRVKRGFEDIAQSAMERAMPHIQKLVKWALDNMPKFGAIVDKVADFIERSMSGAGTAFGGIMTVVMEVKKIFALAWPIIGQLVKTFVDWLSGPSGQALIKSLLEAIGAVLEGVQAVFQAVWPVLSQLVKDFCDWIASPEGTALITGVLDLVATAAQTVFDLFTVIWPTIKDTLLPLLTTILEALAPLVTVLLESLAPVLDAIFNMFTVVWAAIGPALVPIIKTIVAAIKPLADIISGIFTGLKWILDHLSGVSYINPALTNPNLGAPGEAGEDALKDLYKNAPFAWGGFSNKPAIFGEAGLEVAIPLTKGRARAQQLVNQAGLAPDLSPLIAEMQALRQEFKKQNDRYIQLATSGAVA